MEAEGPVHQKAFLEDCEILANLPVTCELWMMRGGTLLILSCWVKSQGQLGTLCIKPCWHNTDCSFSPITFKLQVVDDEMRNPIDFR